MPDNLERLVEQGRKAQAAVDKLVTPVGLRWSKLFDMDSIPDAVLYAEVGRRRARLRKTYTGGVYWAKHNPKVNNCRCQRCMAKREKKRAK